MDEKKPSTADILAKIRAQKAAAAAEASSVAPAETPASAAAEPVAAAATPESPAPAAKPAAPAAKPGSTKDILAAIRAKGAGSAAATPAAVAPPAGAAASTPVPAAAKPTVAAASAAPRPYVQDMLKAVREGKAGAAVATPVASGIAKPVVVAPPVPAKPVPVASKKAAPAPQRRSLAAIVSVALVSLGCFVGAAVTGSWFLFLLGMLIWSLLMSPFMAAWAALAEVTALGTLETARFMMPNVLVEPPSKFKVGPLSDYPLNSVSNKWKDQYGVWIIHTDQYEGQNLIFALASVCTHLGCTPSWLDGEQKFKCPCHGSGFYITGVNFEGPAPRPLERMGVKIAEGMLEVDKSMKFQEEMGQWTDPASFIAVS
jgi:cytochrome b6-f complex iron-sulfur subunit